MDIVYRIGRRLFREVARGFTDFRVIGAEKLRFDGPALIACNHVSFLDPPFVGQAFEEAIHYFARKTLFDHPLAGWVLRRWQAIPIDRDKPDASALKQTIRLLKEGKKVLIFPEGTRSPDGQLQSAEAGVGLFIAKSQVPVLPVRIFGTYDCFPRGCRFPQKADVTLVVGDLWQPDLPSFGKTGKDLYQALADEVMHRIGGLSR
ncbi:MAG: 1-acyl-sn-glycerol-3-phosphate acyltransferase [Verrucomicrobiaceae bacterium]|jgi:1-acyl-sn-glycerol-3-phosphate acyltransferase|nr:1-acyl-sn-glycerol-3-phosphate acyltransferase [Verrucomicrobiaceae bacterium]